MAVPETRNDFSQRIVICGGGVIGVSIAYHLAKKGVACTIIERCGIACAASGKAGGFLARDWCDTYEMGPLSRKGYDMHHELSAQFPNTDYRKLDTLHVTVADDRKRGSGQDSLPSWVNGPVVSHHFMGTPATTAQVHPYKLTHALLKSTQDIAKTEVKYGVIKDICVENDKVVGVKVNEEVIPADIVVVAMGPWSGQATKWLKLPFRVTGNRAHSILMHPPQEVTPFALFLECKAKHEQDQDHEHPEVYPRPDGDVYVCGMGDREPLPDDPDAIKPNNESCKTLQDIMHKISSNFAKTSMHTSQACYLPVLPDGLPVIGKIPNIEGAYIASGHSCWGILTSPSTGAAMAELIVDGHSSVVDLSAFDPARFYTN